MSADPAIGSFTGAYVSSTTRVGSPFRKNTLRLSVAPGALGVGAASGLASATDVHLSGTAEGRLGLHPVYYFSAIEGSRSTSAFPSIFGAGAQGDTKLDRNAIPSVVNAAQGLGIQLRSGPNPEHRTGDAESGLFKIDFQRKDDGVVSISLTAFRNQFSRGLAPVLAAPSADGKSLASGGTLLFSGVQPVGKTFLDVWNVSGGVTKSATTPYNSFPSVVVLADARSDGTVIPSIPLQLGGSIFGAATNESRFASIRDELRSLSADGMHRRKFGGELRVTSQRALVDEAAGIFTYDSLDALQRNTPSSFTRTIGASNASVYAESGALFAGDEWRTSHHIDLQYGLRLDATRLGKITSSPLATAGAPTSSGPIDLRVSPRFGFSTGLGRHLGSPIVHLEGTLGQYVGEYNLSSLAGGNLGPQAIARTLLQCVGSDTPVPDWIAISAGASGVPTGCAAVPASSGTLSESGAPNISYIGRGIAPPRQWRGTLAASMHVFNGWGVVTSGSISRGRAQLSLTDQNLNTQTTFTLPGEAGRPVFLAPAGIDVGTGRRTIFTSRTNSAFGNVLQYGSSGESNAAQVSIGISPPGRLIPGSWGLTYTYTNASVHQNGFNGTTAGNPELFERQPAPYARRHQWLLAGRFDKHDVGSFSLVGRAMSGLPFTPIVAGDINGDGLQNDRAYVFNPASAAPAVAGPLRSLLAEAPSYARSCLARQTGSGAGAGSCTGPWWVTADAQLSLDPALFGRSRRVSASLRLTNLAAAADALLHGGNTKGWGSPTFVDPVLLRTTSFDPATRRFGYAVNPRFGAGLGTRGLINPFAVTLNIRVVVGPDPRGARLASQLGRRAGQTRKSAAAIKALYLRRLINPARYVLQIRDDLMLSQNQVRRIEAIAEGFDADQDSLWVPLSAKLAALPPDFNATRMIERVNATYSEGQIVAMKWGKELARILTKEQRDETPAYVQEIMAGSSPFAEMIW